MPRRGAFSIVDLAVVLAALVILLAASLPVLAGAGTDAGIQQSMSNLVAQSAAHLLYAADWNGRQVTHVVDDLGAYGGDVSQYNAAHGCSYPFDPGCQPPIIAGVGPTQSGAWVPWAYSPTTSNNIVFQPINFPGPPSDCTVCNGWGYFRVPQIRPFHDYLNGRYQDPVFYAPNDTTVLDPIAGCIDLAPEFVGYPDECNPAWSSYCRSPAALFHPDVFRSNAAGGWQAPYELDYGYECPGLFQAAYPDLKTHMLEHSWVQNPPAPCNPAYYGCEPYYFNAGIGSSPVTLFYDGHVRLLPNNEVLFADFQVLAQTGQVDGLWHRGTPFGAGGYFIDSGYDGVPLSHHILTTDGILGRDTISGTSAMPSPMSWQVPWQPRPHAGNRRAIAAPQAAVVQMPFEPADD